MSDSSSTSSQYFIREETLFNIIDAIRGVINSQPVYTLNEAISALSQYSGSFVDYNLNKPFFLTAQDTESLFFNEYKISATPLGECLTQIKYSNLPDISIDTFRSCSNLKYIEFSDSTITNPYYFMTIGADAFRDCSNLTTAIIPQTASIQNGAFAHCINLSSIDFGTEHSNLPEPSGEFIPRNWKASEGLFIGSQAFTYCGLTSLNLSNVNNLGNYCFAYCSKLSQASIIFNLHGILGEGGSFNLAFYSCPVLEQATFSCAISQGSIAFNIDECPSGVFYNCFNLTTVYLSNLAKIGHNMFINCSKLTTITGLDTIVEVGANAFKNCTNLTSIILSNAEKLNIYAFSNCTNLTTVELPKITYIDIGCFNNCANLTTIKLNSTTMTTIDVNPQYIFYSCSALEKIIVGSTLLNTYKNDSYWGAYSNIIVAS